MNDRLLARCGLVVPMVLVLATGCLVQGSQEVGQVGLVPCDGIEDFDEVLRGAWNEYSESYCDYDDVPDMAFVSIVIDEVGQPSPLPPVTGDDGSVVSTEICDGRFEVRAKRVYDESTRAAILAALTGDADLCSS